jgi:N-methylhydantoinase B
MTKTEPGIDAVSLGIMWDRLVSLTDEILTTLVRSSFSSIARESYDLSVVVLDAEGNAIAQGSYSVPSFTGTAAPTLRHMLRKFPPETLRPGDIIATNDAWMGTGHLFDISVMRPVFRGPRLIGYTLSISHLPDIGGIGFSTAATEIFLEGLRLPICRLAREGEVDDFILDLFRANSRVPDQTVGDVMANITCNEVGGRQLLEFMDDFGLDDLAPLSRAIRAQAESALREKIRAWPDGTYRYEADLEGIDEPIHIAASVKVEGDGVAIDFDGTSGCVDRGINVPFCYTRAMANYAIKCLTVPSIPNNEGATAPIAISAPEGCILNAMPPSATGGRHLVGHFVTPAIFSALAKAAPGMAQADCGMINIANFLGTHRDGRQLSNLFFAAGGFGALEGQDGAATTPGPTNMAVVPVEIWEGLTSLTILRKELAPDSGGPGAARGGVGQETVMRNDTGHPLTVFTMGYRTRFPARGLLGGEDGQLRETRINGATVHPKGQFTLEPGEQISFLEAGGGGFGDPAARDRRLVLRDVRNGFVSVAGAKRDYGVEIDPAGSG